MSSVTKAQVKDFVEKCEKKAINAITEQYNNKYKVELQNWMFLPENREIFNATMFLKANAKQMHDSYALLKKACGKTYGSFCSESFDPYSDMFLNCTPKHEPLELIKKERDEEIKKCRKEYGKIHSIIKEARDGNAARNRLIEMGFQTDYLDTEKSQVDTSVLFPCKQKGLDKED